MPRNAPSPTVRICVQLFAQLNRVSMSAFQFLAAFFIPATAPFQPIFTSISGHFNAAFHTLSSYVSHFTPIDQFIPHFNQITSFIIALLTFLQLKYQGLSESSFATHPREMNVAVASYAVHSLACAAVLRFPPRRFAFLAHHLVVSSGNIGAASLLSVTLPERAAPCVYAIFGLLSAAELLLWLYRKLIAQEIEAEHWIRRRRFRRFWNNLFPNLGNTSASQLMRMRLQV